MSARFQRRDVASWRIAFALMDHVEQVRRIQALADQGWSELSVMHLTGWDLGDIRRALAERSQPIQVPRP